MHPRMLRSPFFWRTIFIPPPSTYVRHDGLPARWAGIKSENRTESRGTIERREERGGRLSAVTYRWANNERESMYIAGGESIAWPSISLCGGVIEFSPGSCVSQVPSPLPLFHPFRSLPFSPSHLPSEPAMMFRKWTGELLSCERIPL
jgi:hypothetical protein